MSRINLHNKRFCSIFNTINGQVNVETIFHYYQERNVVWAMYKGGQIRIGTLSGFIKDDSKLSFRYGHWDIDGVFRTGSCTSQISIQDDGRIRLQESWQWDDEKDSGESTLVEIV